MSKLKSLTISVTYTVTLCDVDVPEPIREQLVDSFDGHGELTGEEREYEDAYYWIGEYVKEKDASDWVYQIDELEE